MAGYYRGGRRQSLPPLTPPDELIGKLVKWRPKNPQGQRMTAVFGRVLSHDPAARTLDIEVQRDDVSFWQQQRTRTVTVALSNGPFTEV